MAVFPSRPFTNGRDKIAGSVTESASIITALSQRDVYQTWAPVCPIEATYAILTGKSLSIKGIFCLSRLCTERGERNWEGLLREYVVLALSFNKTRYFFLFVWAK